jgi:hypothetical protein
MSNPPAMPRPSHCPPPAAAGHEALFAGGCVRDRLLGHEPKDYDIATSAVPSEVLGLFPGSNEVGAHFGVVIAKHGGHHVEIATFRTDGSYRDGRRPDSRDLLHRRRRTRSAGISPSTACSKTRKPARSSITSAAWPTSRHASSAPSAIPKARFTEDGLRLLRAVRFAARIGFVIEPATDAALRDCAHLLDRISPERIRDEFSRSSPPRAARREWNIWWKPA